METNLLDNNRPWWARLFIVHEVCSIHSPKATRCQFLSQAKVLLQPQ